MLAIKMMSILALCNHFVSSQYNLSEIMSNKATATVIGNIFSFCADIQIKGSCCYCWVCKCAHQCVRYVGQSHTNDGKNSTHFHHAGNYLFNIMQNAFLVT